MPKVPTVKHRAVTHRILLTDPQFEGTVLEITATSTAAALEVLWTHGENVYGEGFRFVWQSCPLRNPGLEKSIVCKSALGNCRFCPVFKNQREGRAVLLGPEV